MNLLLTRPAATAFGLRPPATLRPLERFLDMLTAARFTAPEAIRIYRAYVGFLYWDTSSPSFRTPSSTPTRPTTCSDSASTTCRPANSPSCAAWPRRPSPLRRRPRARPRPRPPPRRHHHTTNQQLQGMSSTSVPGGPSPRRILLLNLQGSVSIDGVRASCARTLSNPEVTSRRGSAHAVLYVNLLQSEDRESREQASSGRCPAGSSVGGTTLEGRTATTTHGGLDWENPQPKPVHGSSTALP